MFSCLYVLSFLAVHRWYFEKFCGALRGKLRVFTESNSESLREQAKGTKIEGQMVSAAEGNEGKEGGLPQLRPKFELRFPVPEFFTDGNEENEDFRRGRGQSLCFLRCLLFRIFSDASAL